MTGTSHRDGCPAPEALVELSEGSAEARAADPHLASCPSCRADVARMVEILEGMRATGLPEGDPSFVGEVLARQAARAERRSGRGLRLVVPLAAAAVAAVLVVSVAPRDDEPVPRGETPTVGTLIGFEAFLHAARGARGVPVAPGADLAEAASLSFTVLNHSDRALWLMLFGLDHAGEVHWFYPAYLDPADPPRSVPIAPKAGRVALSDAVEPENVAPGDLVLVGWFSERPYPVTRIEEEVGRSGLEALERLPGHVRVQRIELEVPR